LKRHVLARPKRYEEDAMDSCTRGACFGIKQERHSLSQKPSMMGFPMTVQHREPNQILYTRSQGHPTSPLGGISRFLREWFAPLGGFKWFRSDTVLLESLWILLGSHTDFTRVPPSSVSSSNSIPLQGKRPTKKAMIARPRSAMTWKQYYQDRSDNHFAWPVKLTFPGCDSNVGLEG